MTNKIVNLTQKLIEKQNKETLKTNSFHYFNKIKVYKILLTENK